MFIFDLTENEYLPFILLVKANIYRIIFVKDIIAIA